MSMSQPYPVMRPRFGLAIAFALIVVELLVISWVYKHGISFNCRQNVAPGFCSFGSGAVVSTLTLFGALGVFALIAPDDLRRLTANAGAHLTPLWINLAGFALFMGPVLLLQNGASGAVLVTTVLIWLAGALIAAYGLLLFIAPVGAWRVFLGRHLRTLIPLSVVGLSAPVVASWLRPIWQIETVAEQTFWAVVRVLQVVGYDVETYVDDRIIGANDFYVSVGDPCSGVEGFALVTVFAMLYLTLFRQELRFPHALILLPIGLVVSGLLNILRISLLLVMGFEGNPELAIGGFHSHAGWLMFTVVAFGIIAAARSTPWLQKPVDGAGQTVLAPPLPPLRQDPVAARILPFAVFMISALFASAFAANPSVVYPLRALLVGASLLFFLGVYRQLDWAPGWLGVTVGAAIGVMWVLIPTTADGPLPYGDLAGGLLVLWFICRGLGTIVFVPILEELFFRDYLVSKLRIGTGGLWYALAIGVSAAGFAALHGRWAEAFVAALAFSFVYHRTGRISQAIIAHGVANAIVFGVAVATGQMHII